METARLMKQDKLSFAKKTCRKTLRNTFYTIFVVRTNFAVSSRLRGMRTVLVFLTNTKVGYKWEFEIDDVIVLT